MGGVNIITDEILTMSIVRKGPNTSNTAAHLKSWINLDR